MIIRNGNVFFQDKGFIRAGIGTDGDRLVPAEKASGDVLDCEGRYVIPGLVDIHMHGAAGRDFCDADPEALRAIASYEASRGVTSFLGTCMAMDRDALIAAFRAAGEFMDGDHPGCAVMRGINMEGPFLSPKKNGAQSAENCIPFDRELFNSLNDACGGRIRIVDLCPEVKENMDAIPELASSVTVSLAHTSADYDTAKKAFAAGVFHVTHLFNAMPSLLHREPGVIGAAIEDASDVELICDGVHVHPSVIRTAFRLFGDGRLCMISDSMSAAGMPDGEYHLGGQKVFMRDGKAVLANGTIAGAAVSLDEDLRRAVSFGVPLEQAVRACTSVPARAVKMDGEIGTIDYGRRADLLILNEDLSVFAVILGGERIV